MPGVEVVARYGPPAAEWYGFEACHQVEASTELTPPLSALRLSPSFSEYFLENELST